MLLDLIISVFGSASLLALLVFLAKNLFLTRLKAAVEHEFDVKLEAIKADAKLQEERLRAEIRAREMDIESLRKMTISTMGARRTEVDKRTLDAVQTLWNSVLNVARGRGIVESMAILKFDAALAEAERNSKMQEFAATLQGEIDVKALFSSDAAKCRPYVSSLAYSLSSAHSAVFGVAIAQLTLLKNGLNRPEFISDKEIVEIVKAALPGYSSYLDQWGLTGCYRLVEPLENAILDELRAIIDGQDADRQNIARAASIDAALKSMTSTRLAAESDVPA